jgi:3-hydroxy acid dehydrogenase/malonic semialdehyde reductase
MKSDAPRIVFITGASSGIGAACARAFAASGRVETRLVLTGRSREKLDALATETRAAGSLSHVAILDVRDRASVARCVAELPEDFAAVTHLVNNAGLALGIEPAHEADIDDWETMIDTNVKGLVYCTRALLPAMVANGRGHIVNMGSAAGNHPYPGGNVYGATKAFVHKFTQNLRADLLGKNVRVTSIEPGMVDTGFSTTRFHGDKDKADAVYRGMTPMTADDVAELILFCVDRPAHVNVNSMEIMPLEQAFGPFAVSRRESR